jgi:hypothetical protein
MIGDLYDRKHFDHVDSADSVIQGFVEGYGGLSDEVAFRTAIHAGVHLIGWYNRRPRKGPVTTPPEHIAAGMEIGRDFVLKGWEKDKSWFKDSALAPLFT